MARWTVPADWERQTACAIIVALLLVSSPRPIILSSLSLIPSYQSFLIIFEPYSIRQYPHLVFLLFERILTPSRPSKRPVPQLLRARASNGTDTLIAAVAVHVCANAFGSRSGML